MREDSLIFPTNNQIPEIICQQYWLILGILYVFNHSAIGLFDAAAWPTFTVAI